MDALLGCISLLLVANLVMLPHEFAHAFTAKALGLHVDRFEVGFPVSIRFRIRSFKVNIPASLRFRIFDIPVAIGLIPVHGILEVEEEWKDVNVWKRNAILVAGPLANIVIGAGLFVILMTPGLRHTTKVIMEAFGSNMKAVTLTGGSQLEYLAWQIAVLSAEMKLTAILFLISAFNLCMGILSLAFFILPATDGFQMMLNIAGIAMKKNIVMSEKSIRIVVVLFVFGGIAYLVYDLAVKSIFH